MQLFLKRRRTIPPLSRSCIKPNPKTSPLGVEIRTGIKVAMAAGYRRMADVVKEHLRAKMQSGGEAVVSAADVENMFRDVRGGV